MEDTKLMFTRKVYSFYHLKKRACRYLHRFDKMTDLKSATTKNRWQIVYYNDQCRGLSVPDILGQKEYKQIIEKDRYIINGTSGGSMIVFGLVRGLFIEDIVELQIF